VVRPRAPAAYSRAAWRRRRSGDAWPGKHVREVDNDEAKAIVHSAVSAVVRNGGIAVAARSFARPWRARSAESERERGEAKGEVSEGAGSSGAAQRRAR
jgi:O-acetyl-ADP-ribose deacetylase (regulator of RNase III)